MKDRESILKVIQQQRMARTERSFRIYQVLKLIKCEIEYHGDRGQEYKHSMYEVPQKEIIQKQFDRCLSYWLNNTEQFAGGDKHSAQSMMRNDQVFSLMRLCSGNNHMTKEECLLFLHRIHLQKKFSPEKRLANQNQSADAMNLHFGE